MLKDKSSALKPSFEIEQSLNLSRIAGIDEAGRGPLAGPVVAAALILPFTTSTSILSQINDSKKLSAPKRATLYQWLTANCLYGIGEASAFEIDQINILQATFLAMIRAINQLNEKLDSAACHALIDGHLIPKNFPVPATAVVKGDNKSLSIAGASIIAKQHRDLIMQKIDMEYPEYGFKKNAGYGTKAHRDAIYRIGLSAYHRRSFTVKY